MMKPGSMTRTRGQVFSIGNYLMTGKVLGKGHFARVEEATHRVIGKKVAIKIIDLTLIKEEYARRNLHREPRVMARLRHPCIAALYETMMHGPRLYVVMEAAGGGDLCAHVLSARGATRGLPEARARALAAQLVSAVRHMHAKGVVHRDLKMENIMLDSTKQFIKIVDFGLSNLWSCGGALRTPCGSLEYAAPELFVDGRRYGPEVDLWSIGVIVYGMVTGGLPFTAPDGGDGKSRPQLRAAIARGLTAKQRAATSCVSAECRAFIQRLLEPNVEQRMKIEDASRHRWVRRQGMRMKTHPLTNVDPRVNREIYRQISEISSQTVMDVVAQIRADPFGNIGGIYNIKTHLHQMQAVPGTDLLWAATTSHEPRPLTPPEYKPQYEEKADSTPSTSKAPTPPLTLKTSVSTQSPPYNFPQKLTTNPPYSTPQQKVTDGSTKPSGLTSLITKPAPKPFKIPGALPPKIQTIKADLVRQSIVKKTSLLSPRSLSRPVSSLLKKSIYKSQENGDCCLDPRLPSIDEHSMSLNESNKDRARLARVCARKMDESRLNSCAKGGEVKRTEFYRRAGDGLPSWATIGALPTPARLLLQNTATTIKRASLGNIVSPHSSTNSHCKSERATPVSWYTTRSPLSKETPHLQRFRRTAPMK